MRIVRALSVAALPLLPLLAACGGDAGARALTAEEQKYADAFARDLSDADDGLAVDAEGGDCIGTAIMRELGLAPFREAKLAPADLAGDESPGELLGKGTVSDGQASDIAAEWKRCVDLPKLFARQASDQFGLDEDGIACFEDKLDESEVLDDYLRISFTSDDPDDGRAVLNEIVLLVQACTASASGEGGVVVDSIAASLTQSGTLDEGPARCVAQHVVDDLGADTFQGMGSGGSFSDAPLEVQQALAEGIVTASRACGIDPSTLGG
jgi:hypothetical protein